MKKKLSLIAFITMSIFTVFMFLPCIYTETYYKNFTPGFAGANELWSKPHNISVLNPLLSFVLVVFAIISIIVLILQFARSNTDKKVKLKFLPILTSLLFIGGSIFLFMTQIPNGEPEIAENWGYNGFFSYEPAWGFFIAAALAIVVMVLSFLISSKKVKFKECEVANKSMEHYSSIEEIKELKDLLDSGIITQEEFDQKKKQLLGL